MKKAVLMLALVPCALFGQLDRVRTDMTETEFVKAFPEAHRDLEAEAVWVDETDTIDGIQGSALWRIYNDTVSVYRFVSVKAQGPSQTYPGFDSTAVHKMRQSAETLKAVMEKQFGQPSLFVSVPFTKVGASLQSIQPAAFWATWKFADNDYISIKISTDLSSGNFINAPGKYTVVESQSYEYSIEVLHRSPFTQSNYCVGMRDKDFFKVHPHCYTLVKVNRDHVYSIADSAVSREAKWEFTFSGEMLLHFTYKAYIGTGYSADSDKAAYEKGKTRTQQLYREGKTAFGEPAESWSNLDTPYEPHSINVAYNDTHLHAMWTTKRGNVMLDYTENGGGKNLYRTYYIQIYFEFTP